MSRTHANGAHFPPVPPPSAEDRFLRYKRDLHQRLIALHVPHLWKDYGLGCHTVPNFEREIADSLPVLATAFAHPQPAPASFSYMSIEPHFNIWGWHLNADPARALEWLWIQNAAPVGLTLVGSGTTTVTTPPLFRRLHLVGLSGGTSLDSSVTVA